MGIAEIRGENGVGGGTGSSWPNIVIMSKLWTRSTVSVCFCAHRRTRIPSPHAYRYSRTMRKSVWQRKVRINVVELGPEVYRPTIADAAVVPRVDQFYYHFDRCYTTKQFGCRNWQKRLAISSLFINYVVRNLLRHWIINCELRST